MLRIGRGIWRGQVLRPDLNGVRPTPSRVREALMSILSEKLKNAVVWDLFCGSGSFGINCVSCGAERAVFVDRRTVNLKIITKFFKERNAAERCVTVKTTLPEGLDKLVKPADIVFMDPPYANTDIYSWIQEYKWDLLVRPGGIVVVESGGVNFGSKWQHRKYGDTHIHIMEV